MTTLKLLPLLSLVGCVAADPSELPAAWDGARRPTVLAGGAIELHFTRPGTTPENGEDPELDDAIVALIDRAEQRVDAALYEFNRQNVVDALLRAEARGVEVRFAGDGDEIEDAGYEALAEAAVPLSLRPPRDRIMHDKFLVVDDRWIWTGSTNFSDNGVLRNNNHGLLIDSPALAAAYVAESDQMQDARFGTGKEVVAGQGAPVTVGDLTLTPWFAPKSNPNEALLAMLEGAEHLVVFNIFSFTRADVRDRLIALHQAGVPVVGIFDESQAVGRYSVDEAMAEAGVPVYIDGNGNASGFSGGKLHHKVLVVDPLDDDAQVAFGSYNWSDSASRYNDENLVVGQGRELAAAFYEEFCRRLPEATIHPSYAGDLPDPCSALLRRVRINEVMPNPDGADRDLEWLEIVNAGAAPVDLAGWTVGDVDNPARHAFEARVLQPQEAIVIAATTMIPGAVAASTGQLGLANGADEAVLVDAEGTVVDRVGWTNALSGVSFNRVPDGGAEGDFAPHDAVPGAVGTGSPGTRADGGVWYEPPPPPEPEDPPVAVVLINEVMANPAGADSGQEWVELVNVGTADADLTGWALGDAISPVRHVFPAGAVLPASGVLLLWDAGDHGAAPVSSSGSLSLNTAGDLVTLLDATGAAVSSITYGPVREGVSMNRSPDGDPMAPVTFHDAVGTTPASPGSRADGGAW